jgi:uncharacterized repeat protein (TIGR01451 family)
MRRTFAPVSALNRTLRLLSLFLLSFVFAIAQHLWFPSQSSIAAPSAQIAILNTFVPNTINPGVDTTYRLTFRNSTSTSITITSLNHTLTNTPGPITIASTTPSLNTCGGSGTVTLNSGTEPTPGGSAGISGSFSISGYTIPAGAPGECVIEFPVRGFSAGNHTDTIPAGALFTSAGENLDPTSATLQVNSFAPATLSKSFAPNTIPGDGRSTVTITITNPNNFPLTGTTTVPTLVDILPNTPSQLFVDTRPGAPAPTTTCTGGTASIVTGSGDTQVQLVGGTIPANNGSCRITFPVTSAVSGTYTNTIPSNSLNTQNRISNSNAPAPNLAVQTSVTIAKSGLGNNLPEGAVRTITITVTNGGPQINGLSVTDPLPTLLEIAPSPNARSTCNATGANTVWAIQPTAGDNTFTLNSANLGVSALVPASDPITNAFGTCTIQVNVRTKVGVPNPEGSNSGTNTIDRNTNFSNTEGRVPPADATDGFSVIAGINVAKTYSPNLIAPGSTTRVTIAVTNRSPNDISGVDYTDTLPTSGGFQLSVANPPNPNSTGCGSPELKADAGASSVELSSGAITAGATCSFSFDVVAPANTPVGTNFDNTIENDTIINSGGLSSDGVTGTEGRLSVGSRVTVNKSFSPVLVSRGLPSTLTLTITNNRRSTGGIPEPLNNVGITDNLPSNLQVANPPNLSNTCNGTITGATFGDTSVALSGGSIPPSSSCTIKFNVIEIDRTTTPLPRTYVNIIEPSDFVNDASEPATLPTTADLTVVSPLSGVKSFQSPAITANGISRATIEFRNTDLTPLTNLSFTDSWTQPNTNLTASPNFQTTCTGGTFTPINSQSFSFASGQVPAQVSGVPGICTVSFDVTIDGTGANTFTNTIGATTVTTTQGFTNPNNISGTLTRVTNNLSVIKSFTPQTLNSVGDPSVLKVDITNPGSSGLVANNVNFVDTMDPDILVFPVPNPTTANCGSPTILLPGDARPSGVGTLGPNEFGITGGTINAGGICTITIRTTLNTAGNRTNTIPANSIVTREGTTNTAPASATINALPALNITKAFAPSSIAGGQISRLTITVQNRQISGELGGPLTNIRFTDALPANLLVAGTPNATTTCTNGVFNPVLVGGETSFTLQGFDLPFNTSCTAAINVIANIQGTYVNTIPVANVEATLQTSIGGGKTTSNGPATATLDVTSTVLPPEVILVKRITRINNTDITGFVDGPGTEDNDAKWPNPTTDSLRGAISQTNVRPQDEVEYTIYYLNRGQSSAGGLRICDPIPANTSYVASAFNGFTPTDGGLPADLGIALQTGTTVGDRRFLTGVNDAPDRGRYYDPALGEVPAATGSERCADPNNPNASLTSNPNGIVAVNVTRTTGTPPFPLVPNATGAGIPPESYGFVRFRVRVR